MNPKHDLDSFLHSLSQGQAVSSGEFKVDPSELLRKFGALLPDSEGWVIKVLQALCHWGAQNVDIKIKRRTLTLAANGISPSQPLTCTTVFQHEKEWRGHYHLFAAVLNLINDDQYERFALRWNAGEAFHDLVFEGESLVRAADTWREKGEVAEGQFRLELTKRVSRKKGFQLFWKADFGDILSLVRCRCRCFPVEVRLDGKVVDFPELLEVAKAVEDDFGLVVDDWSEPVERTSGLLGVQVFYDPERKGLGHGVAPGNYLAWIQDGVVADFENAAPRKDMLSVVTYVDGRGLANDLTTLQIRQSAEKKERLMNIAKVLQRRARVLESLSWRVSNVMPQNPGRYIGPVRATEVVSAMLQSSRKEMYRDEHKEKVRRFERFKRLKDECVWLSERGNFLHFSAQGKKADSEFLP